MVADQRTWTILEDGGDAPNMIEVVAGTHDANYAVSFANILDTGETLSSVTSVAVVSGSAMTIGAGTVDTATTGVEFVITHNANIGERKIQVIADTSENNTLIGQALLVIV